MHYYIKGSNKIYGPFSAEKVHDLLANKKINLNVQVSTDQKSWRLLKTFPELAPSDAAQGSATPVKSAPSANNNAGQSNILFGASAGTSTSASSGAFSGISTGSKSSNSSGSLSFDFLQKDNSSASAGNANNAFPQQQQIPVATPVQSTPVATSGIPVPEEQWFISSDGVNGYGPYPTSQIVAMIQNGQVLANHLAWRQGENAAQISILPSFAGYFNAGFNPMANNGYSPSPRGRKRYHGPTHSRTTYILLGLFFGNLGIHNFYAGYSGRGAIQLISTCLCVGFFFVPIWALIEICTVTKDARGVPFD